MHESIFKATQQLCNELDRIGDMLEYISDALDRLNDILDQQKPTKPEKKEGTQ